MENYKELHLDFEQAKAKHLLFKSRLRSILYGISVDETPVNSHLECSVGKWIYSYALKMYGHLPEMQELEKVHTDIHLSARHLIKIYKEGKVEEARQKLLLIEPLADNLVDLLGRLEQKVKGVEVAEIKANPLKVDFQEFTQLLNLNQELDLCIKEQVMETVRQKERFELIAKATQDAVWDWDLVNHTLWWNEGFTTLFGYKKGELGSSIESWYNKIHPEDKERVLQTIHTVIEKKSSQWGEEYRFQCADGSYAFVYDRSYCLFDKSGNPKRMVGSMQDVTKFKQVKESLIQKNQQLTKINNDLDSFVYTASHDLKAPIANMEGLLTILKKMLGNKIEKRESDVFQMMQSSVARFKNTIDDLTEITKTQVQVNQDIEKVDLYEVLKNVISNMEDLMSDYKPEIKVRISERFLHFSKKDLFNILYNLVSNGIKYSSPTRRPEIRIHTMLRNSETVLTVEDNGLGFDIQNKEKIFGMFRRLHNHIEGSGIGLYIVKRIVENSGGTIDVESEVGKGTKFTLTFKKSKVE